MLFRVSVGAAHSLAEIATVQPISDQLAMAWTNRAGEPLAMMA